VGRIVGSSSSPSGAASMVTTLLLAVSETDDRVLAHSLTYALIEINDPKTIGNALSSGNPAIRRAALIALDQMDGGGLEPKTVAPLLAAGDQALRETALWIAGRHPEWSGALAGPLRERLRTVSLAAQDREALEHLLARLAGTAPIQELLA